MSTTLIQPGSEFKLGFSGSSSVAEGSCCGSEEIRLWICGQLKRVDHNSTGTATIKRKAPLVNQGDSFLLDCDPTVDTPIWFCGWWIDPSCGWFGGWCWRLVDEALRVLAAGAIERVLASGVDGIDLAIMNLVWGHQADSDVVMVVMYQSK